MSRSFWKSKPPAGTRVDFSHPLAQGLRGCWIFNEQSGRIVTNICSGSTAYLQSNSVTPAWCGTGYRFAGSPASGTTGFNGSIPRVPIDLASEGVGSIVVGVSELKSTGSLGGFVETRQGSSTPNYRIRITASGSWDTKLGTNSFRVSNYAFTALPSKYSTLSLCFDQSNSYMYTNGNLDRHDVQSNSIDNSFFTDFYLGSGSLGAVGEPDGIMLYVYIWPRRILSNQEVNSIHNYPYQFMEQPLFARSWFLPLSGGGGGGGGGGTRSKRLLTGVGK